MNDVKFSSVVELSRALQAKEVSAVELAKAYLERIEAHKDLNCFLDVRPEVTLAQAQAADKRIAEGKAGRLTGIPIAHKDIFVTRDWASTAASKMLKGYTYEEAMEKIPNGIGGDMCIVSRSTGLTLYLHYEPVGINNWSVVLGVSEQDALAGTRGVVKILYLMSVIVGAILLSYLAYISWYLISARRGVYRMSITDQGTGLMNRVAYEKCLRKSDQRVIAPAACIYIDANGLHEINNERGHEAGDQLLRAVAERLREQFPRDDLYRVGGDEFVVFPAPAAEAEYEARMRAVSESLAAQGHSISYGIAVCEAANGLRELVREADEKMLGSKRAYYAEHDRRRPR